MNNEICSLHAVQHDMATTSIDMNASFEESIFLVGRILQTIMAREDISVLKLLRIICLVLDELLKEENNSEQFEWNMDTDAIKDIFKDYLASDDHDESEEI